MEPRADSLERLVPDRLDEHDVTGQATLELHLERYRFAAKHLRPGRVLDLACGVGYGSRLLAEERDDISVLGVDLADAAITHARENYHCARLEFRVGDALTFQDAEGFETIVSLETIEHVPDPDAVLASLAGLLCQGGRLIASVPTTPSVDLNPHHLHDFTEASIRARVRKAAPDLREIDALRQIQPVKLLPVLLRTESRMSDLRTDLAGYYLRKPGAFLRRIGSTLRYGLSNRYFVGVWERS